jgi:proline iminopeptidase
MLRGIFLARVNEYAWLYGPDGVARIFPERYAEFLEPIPFAERHEILAAYHRRLMGPDQEVAERCALAWSVWEGAIARLIPQDDVADVMGPIALAFARIECHYFIHGCWLGPDQLLEGARAKLQDIPVVIAQGRYDVICPVQSAYELAQALPQAELHIAPASGHSVSEPEITAILIRAMDAL